MNVDPEAGPGTLDDFLNIDSDELILEEEIGTNNEEFPVLRGGNGKTKFYLL